MSLILEIDIDAAKEIVNETLNHLMENQNFKKRLRFAPYFTINESGAYVGTSKEKLEELIDENIFVTLKNVRLEEERFTRSMFNDISKSLTNDEDLKINLGIVKSLNYIRKLMSDEMNYFKSLLDNSFFKQICSPYPKNLEYADEYEFVK